MQVIIQHIEAQYNVAIEEAVQQYLDHLVMLRNLGSRMSAKTLRRQIVIHINTFMSTLANVNQVRQISLDTYEPPRKRQRTA
jgi:hypothetical protein